MVEEDLLTSVLRPRFHHSYHIIRRRSRSARLVYTYPFVPQPINHTMPESSATIGMALLVYLLIDKSSPWTLISQGPR